MTSKSSWVVIAMLCTIALLVSTPPAGAQGAPTLIASTYYGQPGTNQGSAAVSVQNGFLYVSGYSVPRNGVSDTSVLLRYGTPLGNNVSPGWSRPFDFGTSFFGLLAPPGSSLYAVGSSYSLTTDGVGGKESKTLLANFPLDGSSGPGPGGSNWVTGGPGNLGPFFVYSGGEGFEAILSAVEGAATFIYASGGAQPCSQDAYLIAKYDASGNFVGAATDSAVGISFNNCFVPDSAGGSDARSETILDGNIVLAGVRHWSTEGDSASEGRAMLVEYDAGLNLLWLRKDSAVLGTFNGVTSLGGAIYAVGVTTANVPGSEDYLIEKYDAAGNLIWRKNFGGANTDILKGVTAVGSRLFAVGYTRSQGSGGADAVIMEIDPSTGDVLSTTLFGGANDDMADAVGTDGTNLFVVGETRSFASPQGNAIGNDNIMVLEYSVATNQPPVANAGGPYTAECAGPSGTNVTLNGAASSDPDSDTLTYQWTDPNNVVVGTSAAVTVTAAMGTTNYTLTVTDPGGLSSTATAQVTVQDTTPPTLTLSQTSVTAVLPTATATGVVSSTLNLASLASATDICDAAPTVANNAPSVFPIGTTQVVFTATDHSGNSTTKTLVVQVVYNFGGYLAPVLNTGQSLFKSGRTIPVKFQLTAADGSVVTNAVATLSVIPYSAFISGSTDFTDATATGNSDAGNTFRFDPTSGGYIFNLSTSGFATGTWLLRTTLNDGTHYDVLVSIR